MELSKTGTGKTQGKIFTDQDGNKKMEILDEQKLISGETLRVLHWDSSEKAPEKYINYILTSVGSSNPHRYLYSSAGWRTYFRDAMSGTYFPDVVDHWFFAEVDGECAGRIWFAYSKKSLRGNFGNVMTEPAFRNRGIMRELMKHCMDAIRRSPANMLCCIASKKITPVYLKYGFQLIHGGESGPLCFIKDGTFASEAEQAFSGNRIMEIRPGEISDQFDCDKFLIYTPELWKRVLPVQAGPAAHISDFRLAFQEKLADNAVVYTALNKQKACCGYAFAVMLPSGFPVLDFIVHPSYLGDSAKLIRTTAEAFRERFRTMSFYYGLAADSEKLAAAQNAGMERIAGIPNGLFRQDQSMDITVLVPKQKDLS